MRLSLTDSQLDTLLSMVNYSMDYRDQEDYTGESEYREARRLQDRLQAFKDREAARGDKEYYDANPEDDD